MSKRYTVQRNAGYYDVIAPDGAVVIDGERYTIANGVAFRCNTGIHGHDELDEVASVIVARHGWGRS